MNTLSYTVKTETFEGPLDLLLDLVTKRKLFINDVSLAKVADDFIHYIEEHEEFPIGESAEFIVIASTLMLIKSRSLLPQLVLSEEEEESIVDLEERLKTYARIKELASKLREIYGKQIIFEKLPSKSHPVIFAPDKKTDTGNLLLALRQVLEALPKKEVVPKAVIKKLLSMEEAIDKLAERISQGASTGFRDFSARELGADGPLTYEKKVAIIVGFLAMLELVRRGAIRVSQEAGGDIAIEKEGVGVPVYI
jgi:segregation and condensation protein A